MRMINDTQSLLFDDTKIQWHRARLEARLAGERIVPVTIDMALTRACNWRCEYCYSRLQNNPSKKITQDVIYRFLDDCAGMGVKAVSLVSDGESTCSPIYIDTIIRGCKNGIDMAMATHGGNFNEDNLEKILPCLTYLRFNITAAVPESYALIHGVTIADFFRVKKNIETAVAVKRKKKLSVTIGLQMVFQPKYVKEIIPLVKLGKELGVDYLVIKHTSDDKNRSLGIDYRAYKDTYPVLEEAERYSTENYLVKVKWNKIKAGDKREYRQCYGPPFILQVSGSGLLAPCGMLFNERYKKFHIGNIADNSFKELWESRRYWEVMDFLAGPDFNAQKMCGYLCLQDRINLYLWKMKRGKNKLNIPKEEKIPPHVNFI